MHPDIDAIRIHFDEGQMTLMYFCLAFIMFGIAIDMTLEDFSRVVRFPRKVLVGLISQWILLPLMTMVLIYVWDPFPSIALGLLLVAACPGGNMSNYATYLSKGNAALSVTLTSIVTVCSILMTPLAFALFARWVPKVHPLIEQIHLHPLDMLAFLFKLILVPLILGMLLRHFRPQIAKSIRKPVSYLSLVIYLGFIITALLSNLENITRYLGLVFALVVVHNLIAMIMGYYWAKTCRLPDEDARAISMETGIQNAGLGLVLIFNFFPVLGGMMLVTAFWAVWDLISSFAIALYWNKKSVGQKKNLPLTSG